MIDSTCIEVHRAAASMACGDPDGKIGKSRGGLASKLHLLRNEFGLPIDFLITGGEVRDVKPAPELIARNRMTRLIADMAYGSAEARSLLERRAYKCCIPAKSDAKEKIPHDQDTYKKLYMIENMLARIKDLKGLALRATRCSHAFISFVSMALVILIF